MATLNIQAPAPSNWDNAAWQYLSSTTDIFQWLFLLSGLILFDTFNTILKTPL